jgi:hypothetical protein
VDFWRASAAAPAWFEGPSIVILERAYKITMTFDVRGAAAGADHGVGRNRLAYSASVSSACGVDSRRSDSSDSVSNASRISLNSDAPTRRRVRRLAVVWRPLTSRSCCCCSPLGRGGQDRRSVEHPAACDSSAAEFVGSAAYGAYAPAESAGCFLGVDHFLSNSLPRWREWCIFVAVRGHGEHLAQPQIRGLVITAPGAYAASSSVEIGCDT